MTTGGHPPPEYAQKSLYVQQPSLRAGVFMVHQHYGTQTVTLTPGTSTTTALPAKSCVLPTTKFTTSEKAEHVSPVCSALIMTLNL